MSFRNRLNAGLQTSAGIALLYAALAALWIVLSGYLLTFTVTDPLLQSRIELAKGLAFVAITSVLLYLLLNHWHESHTTHPTAAQTEPTALPKTIRLALIYMSLVLIVPLVDFAIYEFRVQQTEQDAYDNLTSIAKLKAAEIENWLKERHGDAQGLADDSGLARQVARMTGQHSANPSADILKSLDSLQANHGFDSILLLDSGGRLLASRGNDVGISAYARDLMQRALDSETIQFSDLYRDDAGHITLDWVVPVIVSDRHGTQAVAAVILRAAPGQFLYPLILNWPIASYSGESFLVRREGESVQYLSQLHKHKGAPLTLLGALNDPHLPAAIAIRSNVPGTAPGVDVLGAQVLTAYRPIAGTNWYLVAKLDLTEVMKPVWDLLFWVSLLTSLVVATIMATLLLLLRQQQRSYRLALLAGTAEATRESELRYRTLVGTIPDLVWLKDKDGVYLKCNMQFERLYGASEADIIGNTDYEFVDRELADSFRKHDLKTMESGIPCINEEWLTFAKDGYRGLFETIKTPMHDSEGKLIGVLGISRDITERMRAGEALRKLSQAVEQSPSSIVITDLKANIEYANAAFAKESGYSLEEAIGSNPRLLHSGKTPRATYDDMWAHLANGKPWEGEFINRRKDGSEYFESALISPVIQPDGRMTHFLAIKENISERKSNEIKINRLTQLYAALSLCNGAIVRSTSEQELFDKVCRAAVQFGGMKMAWIGLVDEASKQIRPVAKNGTGTDYLEGLQISTSPDDPSGSGPGGISIRENRPVWIQDYQQDPIMTPWLERGKRFGWNSIGTLPLLRNGTPIGAIMLYSDTVNAFDEGARSLLIEMAADISFALDNFARENERKHAARNLADSEQRFRSLVEQSLAGIFIIQDGKLTYVNPRAAEILGQSTTEQIIGHDPMEFIAEVDRDRVTEYMRQLFNSEVPNIAADFAVVYKQGGNIMVGSNASLASYHGRPAIIGLVQDISEKKRNEAQILEHVDQLKTTFMSTVQLATSLSEMRDPYTAGHERRVADIAVAIATELGLNAQRVEGIKVAGFLHDIGKISIPAEILVKPGKLSTTEYALVQGHAQASYDVLKLVEFPWPVATIALQHHERMDGSGYPNGLKGDEILLESRIMAVADVVEAMASHRPYRAGLGVDMALAEIERGRGSSYDPIVADACLLLFREKGFALPPH